LYKVVKFAKIRKTEYFLRIYQNLSFLKTSNIIANLDLASTSLERSVYTCNWWTFIWL